MPVKVKYENIKNNKALLLALAVLNKKFIIYDFTSDIPYRHIEKHSPYGGKPAYEININFKDMTEYTSKNLIAEIEKILGL